MNPMFPSPTQQLLILGQFCFIYIPTIHIPSDYFEENFKHYHCISSYYLQLLQKICIKKRERLFLVVLFVCLFRAAPAAMEVPRLGLTSELQLPAGFLTHGVKPGSKPHPHGYQSGSLPLSQDRNSHVLVLIVVQFYERTSEEAG